VAIPFCETITTIAMRATVVLLLCPLRQAYSQPNGSRTADCNKRDGPIIAQDPGEYGDQQINNMVKILLLS